MAQSVVQVDAFTNVPFRGNPAAVCVMETAESDEWMQQVAAEMNLSETAFVTQCNGEFGLRWFTPVVEIDLCGHATLASAHVLWSEGYVTEREEIRFRTHSGLLTATLSEDWIQLNFPTQPVQSIDAPPLLLEAVGVEVLGAYANDVNYLVELPAEDELRSLQPDFSKLRKLPLQGVIVTCRGEKGSKYDFLSRYFAPKAGINEDPVTGSSHCSLSPFWSERLQKSDCLAYQASARGGVLKVGNLGDRVSISGQAVTVLRGELL